MKKMSTLYKKDPNNLGRVINEVNPENEWVFTDDGVEATVKFDGTACAIIDGRLYKRYDAKKGKNPPPFAIPCQEPDEITGHWPHWVLCNFEDPADKYHFEAFNNRFFTNTLKDGTYELCGPRIQGNPENLDRHVMIEHGSVVFDIDVKDYSFDDFRELLNKSDHEGIVFHHPDGRMCKLRKSDFGIER